MPDRFASAGLTPPPLEPRWGSADSLGDKLEKTMTRFIQRVITWGWKFIANLMVEVFDQSMKIMRPGTERATDSIFTELLKNPGLPAWIKTSLTAASKEEGESAFIIKLIVMYVTVRSMIFGGLAPYQRVADATADQTVHSFLPDIQTGATMFRAGIISEEGWRNIYTKNGLLPELAEKYLEQVRNLPNLGDYIAGVWRGVISDGEFSSALIRMGHNEKDIHLYRELSKNIPPLTDLIHMMVREAWNDAIVSKFSYDDDYPEDMNDWLKKQGYDADWGKRYWRAHWNLPSPTQAYEMLHRGFIDKATLSELLKTADYPKFWREKLEAISYNVFTRVDIRRMVQADMMTPDEAEKAYREMGYDADKAKKLTEFAVKGISQDEKDLTKAEIVGMYVDGLSDRAVTSAALVKMGYDAQEADSILKMADLDIVKAVRTDTINRAHEKFRAGTLDDAGVTSELTKAGVKTVGVDRYLLQWKREKESAVRIPTIAEAKRFYIGEIITEGQFRENLSANGVASQFVEWFVKEANLAKGVD